MILRPMLSATVDDLIKVRLPCLASPKLDGIRAVIIDGHVISRNGKPIPNMHVQDTFGLDSLNMLDGELIMGEPTSPSCFRDTSSAVMSLGGEPPVIFHVFDFIQPNLVFVDRLRLATATAKTNPRISVVPHYAMEKLEEVQKFEEFCLEQGYEGVMLRSLDGKYKHGRSTMNEQGLMKLKRFMDSEAEVIGMEERMHNGNESTIGALGYTERSSHKDNLLGRGDLGALLVRDLQSKVEFAIGTGFDDALRARLWSERPIGRIVKYKYFPSGSKEKPRFPVFLGFRDARDM